MSTGQGRVLKVLGGGCADPPQASVPQGGTCGCRGTTVLPQGPVAATPVSSSLSWKDRLGTIRVRLGIGRMNYRVRPGLYSVGTPTPEDPVLVSANYKLSFDRVRTAAAGRNVWILVLDTHGINVWCAAGKGLFGTEELVRRVESTGLSSVVHHRKLVLPQLAAPGVAAHDVRGRTGFRVIYGPVRAEDLGAFLDARMVATPEMRRVHYGLADRATLVPVEIVLGAKYPLAVAAVVWALGSLLPAGATWTAGPGVAAASLILLAFLAGAGVGPLLLPWLPGRAFALKGAVLGLALAALLALAQWPSAIFASSWEAAAAWMLIVPAATSFVLMNFTGSSTFTSLSGVLREMRLAVPLQIAAGFGGVALWIVAFYGRLL